MEILSMQNIPGVESIQHQKLKEKLVSAPAATFPKPNKLSWLLSPSNYRNIGLLGDKRFTPKISPPVSFIVNKMYIRKLAHQVLKLL
jgi:hypothetical protein